MPYGDFACLDVRQRAAALRALLNLALNAEDVHEHMQAQVESFNALRRAKAPQSPPEDGEGNTATPAATPPPRGDAPPVRPALQTRAVDTQIECGAPIPWTLCSGIAVLLNLVSHNMLKT